MAGIKRFTDGAVYCSVILGALLLYEAGPLVPSWLLGVWPRGN